MAHIYASLGYTEACFLSLPKRSNLTIPSIVEYKVSSLPRRTLVPGNTLVPRWRYIILPPVTNSPSAALAPNLRPAESRPLDVDPCPYDEQIIEYLILKIS